MDITRPKKRSYNDFENQVRCDPTTGPTLKSMIN